MPDYNPNQALPGSNERISVNELTRQLDEAKRQATMLAKKASSIYKKLHPEDDLKTDIYDPQDFIDKKTNKIVIPEDVEKMFREYEKLKTENNLPKKEEQPSAEELQKVVKGEKIEGSALRENEVKKNPVFDKLMASFGLQVDSRPKTIQKEINGLKLTFEYPSSMITNFALAYASSEHIGSIDFGYTVQLMTVALSIVEIDDVPVTKALNILDNYEHYYEIPSRIRKICGVRMVEFLQSISDKDLEKFMTFYSDNIGFDNESAKPDTDEFVELKCPECGRTEMVSVDNGIVPDRYCRFDGKKMEVQSSNKTDENAPLA